MFYVINLSVDPPTKVEGTDSDSIQDCMDWISLNGDIVNYSIVDTN